MRNRKTCALVMVITFISMCLGHGDYIYLYTTAQPAHYLVLPKAHQRTKSCFMIVYRLSAENQFMKTLSPLL